MQFDPLLAGSKYDSDFLKEFHIPTYIFNDETKSSDDTDPPKFPVLVFINSKSGGQLGGDLIQTYKTVLNEFQVFDVGKESPDNVLRRVYTRLERLKKENDEFAAKVDERLRIIVSQACQLSLAGCGWRWNGKSYCHAVGDGKSFMHFMRSWTSVFRSGGDLACLEEDSLPLINRDVIKDPVGLESIQLKNYWRWVSSCGENSAPTQDMTAGKVRATFVLNRALAERLKHLVTAVDSEQHHISTFVVSCALIWVCLIKSKESIANNSSPDDDDKFYYFLLGCDGRNRLEYPVPATYFGNCLQPCVIDVKKSELTVEDGIVLAAQAIGKKIKEMEGSGLRGAF